MLTFILSLLIILWLLGFVQIPGLYIPNIPLFVINNQTVTLWNLLIFILVVTLLGILPSPLREMAGGILILWLLSILGIIAIAGLSHLLILGIILGLILFALGII
ncbi:MAG: hypothetical protein Q7S88_01615 [Candidatus Daviesbacteria bacterium]|nr:hypothetical protein [Candidatus Daviesbacteria bacterium]